MLTHGLRALSEANADSVKINLLSARIAAAELGPKLRVFEDWLLRFF